MTENKTLKLARVLRVLVLITFVCNLVALYWVPGFVNMHGMEDILELWKYEPSEVWGNLLAAWVRNWTEPSTAVQTASLLLSGVCTAVILWQAKRVLDTILKGEVFTGGNAQNMKRAAVCCFVISAAALVRLVLEARICGSILLPLFTYNALFVPIFLMGGLLFLVMSALFRQAAALKEENDLTI